MRDEIEQVLEDEVRPALARHGGSVELVDVDTDAGVVSVRMQGACRGCPLSALTLKAGIESLLCTTFPQIREVVAVD